MNQSTEEIQEMTTTFQRRDQRRTQSRFLVAVQGSHCA